MVLLHIATVHEGSLTCFIFSGLYLCPHTLFSHLVSVRSMASKTPIGFIGLGNMGSPMARNLLRNGYPVIATDVFPESRKELQDLGAQVKCSQ